MKKFIVPLLCTLAVSCTLDLSTDLSGFPNIRITNTDSLKVEMQLNCEAQNLTKGQFTGSDDMINDVCIFIYKGSVIYDEFYSEGSSVSASLIQGQSYTIYAMANSGEYHAPASIEEMEDFRLSIESDRQFKENGLPMACKTKITPDGTNKTVNLEMTRLVSKYSLTLSGELIETQFDIQSVRICQGALDITPFKENSTPTKTGNGDYASAQDIEELNNGGTVDFYVLENCEGVLLQGNDNPWKKEPSSIGKDSTACTYLEIGTRWSTQGADADMKLRMYLGQDNCKDFNVIRNSKVALTVCLDDGLSYRTSWKAFSSNLNDDRTMNFSSSCLTVYKGNDWTEVTDLELEPSNISYTASASGAGIKAKIDDGKLYLKTEYTGAEEPVGEVSIVSWDGQHTASVNVKATNPGIIIEDGAFITEGGSANWSDEINNYYDWCGAISLADSEGNPLDAGTFDISQLLNGITESFDQSGLAKSKIVLFDTAQGSSFARIYLYGMKETDQTALTYSFTSEYGSTSTTVSILKAFPDITGDGIYYNMSIAPGALRSDKTPLGIYSAQHPAPNAGLTSWCVKHYTGSSTLQDAYTGAMKIRDGIMQFSAPTAELFPSCGEMRVVASTVNPHSQEDIEKEYDFKLVLYMSIGIKADVVGKNWYLRFAPFCEYTTQEYDDLWVENMPQGLTVVGYDGKQYDFPMSLGEYAFNAGLPGYIPGISKPAESQFLKVSDMLDFTFWNSVMKTSANELEVSTLNPIRVNGALTNCSGEKGFYKFVRQSDINNLEAPCEDYEGYQNYIIDAAYDLF